MNNLTMSFWRRHINKKYHHQIAVVFTTADGLIDCLNEAFEFIGIDQYRQCNVTEIGIWDIVLTDGEIKALTDGYSPMLIHPQNLQCYLPNHQPM
jgi:hypothetical protein